MKLLVLNIGSTSFRFSIFDMEQLNLLASGKLENLGSQDSYCIYEKSSKKIKFKYNIKNVHEAIDLMNKLLLNNSVGIINSISEINAIGHRVIHGGEIFSDSTIVNNKTENSIEKLIPLMPLHGPNILETIKLCKTSFKNAINIAVFDTSFHKTIPKENYLYAIPTLYYQKYGIRKYGAHGISYSSVLKRYSNIIQKKQEEVNTIICHLGGGCSMCNIKNGKSFDTTMGFTPLAGLIMATRSGSIDPSIVTYLIKNCNMTVEEIEQMLNQKSGYYGIAKEKDAKKIVEESISGNQNAILLRKMLNIDFKKNLLSMMAVNRPESIILTGGMGTKNKEQREMFLDDLKQFNIIIDKEKNNKIFDSEAIISTEESLPIYVIPDNEEKEIASECIKVLRR